MPNILRMDGPGLSGGSILFTDEEVDTIDIRPIQHQEVRETQARDLRIYFKGGDHYEIDVSFRIARRSTLAKIFDIHEAKDEMVAYPHYPADTATAYTVVLMTPDNFVERLRRGYPRANYTIEMTFREPRGMVCVPPS